MSCPRKKNCIQVKRQQLQRADLDKQHKTYREVARAAAREIQKTTPPSTELVLQHQISFSVLTACILAHLRNIAEPGSFSRHLNKMLRLNNLPSFTADDDELSAKIFNISNLSQQVSTSQDSLNKHMESDDLETIPTTSTAQEMEHPTIPPLLQEKPQPQQKSKTLMKQLMKDSHVIHINTLLPSKL